jgi:putative solute:sodium symporter small subunit
MRPAQAYSRTRYWRHNLLLIVGLLCLWWLVTFVPAYFALELSQYLIFGWPFSFWMAAFGATLVFLLIVGLYAWWMARCDQRARRAPQAGD